MKQAENPLLPFIHEAGIFVMDGALASELEIRGASLNDPLWSAKILLEQPELLEAVNYDYLVAGADMVTTATYQATFEGFKEKGFNHEESLALFAKAVSISQNARDRFWNDPINHSDRIRPLVAGSIGPYGAFLADGSEYSGDYGLSEDELKDFHRERLKVLVDAGIDLIAFETFPSFVEAMAVISLLSEFPDTFATISLSCKDEIHISDGTPFHEVAKYADPFDQVAAIGVNCLPSQNVAALLGSAAAVTDKILMAYPNSGEHWNAKDHCWEAGSEDASMHDLLMVWYALGVKMLGGCCRTGPEDIRKIRLRASELRAVL